MTGPFIRYFIGVPIVQSVRKKILALMKQLRFPWAQVRTVNEKNFHVSLKPVRDPFEGKF